MDVTIFTIRCQPFLESEIVFFRPVGEKRLQVDAGREGLREGQGAATPEGRADAEALLSHRIYLSIKARNEGSAGFK